MKFLVTIMAVLLSIGLLAGCTLGMLNVTTGSGNVISEDREVNNFDGVDLAGSGDLIITQGDEEALVIEAEDNILPLIESEVRNGTLRLGMKPTSGIVNTRRGIKYYLTVQNLSEIMLSGSGSISAEQLDSGNLAVNVSGSGEVAIDELTADEVSMQISGSGNIDVAGSVDQQRLVVSGSGNYRAGDLASQIADIRVSGSGEATVWASESLNIEISGSGDVEYYGNPQVNQQTSGSGSTRSLGDK
jgi:hypothetical protein